MVVPAVVLIESNHVDVGVTGIRGPRVPAVIGSGETPVEAKCLPRDRAHRLDDLLEVAGVCLRVAPGSPRGPFLVELPPGPDDRVAHASGDQPLRRDPP